MPWTIDLVIPSQMCHVFPVFKRFSRPNSISFELRLISYLNKRVFKSYSDFRLEKTFEGGGPQEVAEMEDESADVQLKRPRPNDFLLKRLLLIFPPDLCDDSSFTENRTIWIDLLSLVSSSFFLTSLWSLFLLSFY